MTARGGATTPALKWIGWETASERRLAQPKGRWAYPWPQTGIGTGTEAFPGPWIGAGGYKGRSRAPGAARSGYWRVRGGAGDSVVGVVGEACWYSGLYNG